MTNSNELKKPWGSWPKLLVLSLLIFSSGCLQVQVENDAWVHDSTKAIEERRYADAKAVLEGVPVERRNELWYELAYATSFASWINDGSHEMAAWGEAALESGAEKFPQDPHFDYRLAMLFQASGRPEEATRKFDAARESAESIVRSGTEGELLRSAEWVLKEMARKETTLTPEERSTPR